MKKMKKFSLIAVGTDPEVFIRDTKKEKFVSGEGLIGGTKEEPTPIAEGGFAIQEDNVMAEFCVPPARDAETMADNIDFVINYLNKKVEGIDPNLMIVITPSAVFNPEDLTSEQATTVGCDPDFNAWFGIQNPIPDLPLDCRFAGGHVHISYEEPSEERNMQIVKVLDLFLGVPAVLMDIDDRRKEIYGTPGRFRNKKYGVEYRTLSNFWIASRENINFVFEQINKAFEFLNNENNEVSNEIPICIDTNDKAKAIEICKTYNIVIPENKFIDKKIQQDVEKNSL